MVHAYVLDRLSTQFADAPFDAGVIAIGVAIFPPIFRQCVGSQTHFLNPLEIVNDKTHTI